MKIKTCAAMAALTIPGSAAVLTWNSATPGGTWDTTSSSWLNGASPSAWSNSNPDSAIFAATGAGTVTLGEPITAGGLTVNAAGYTIAGSNLTLTGTTPTITTANDLAISSILDGTAPLVKAGAATLDLSGANSYSGATTVNGGTLKLSAPQTGTGNIAINTGTLALNGGQDSSSYSLTRTRLITANAGTTIDMLVALPWGWYANNNANGLTLDLNGGSFKMNGKRQGSFGVDLKMTGGSVDGGGVGSRWDLGRSGGFDVGIRSFASAVKSTFSADTLMLRPDSLQTLYPINVAQGTTPDGVDLEISSNIGGTATSPITLRKTGTGTLKLTGVSSYGGTLQVSQGKVVLGATGNLAAASIAVTGGIFDISQRADFTLASAKTLAAGQVGAPQTNIVGNIVVAAGGIVNPAGLSAVGPMSITGNLALNGATLNVEQVAGVSDEIRPGGTLALTGTNTFTGLLPNGTYTLASGYTAVSGNASNLAWNSGAVRGTQTASFSVTPASVQVTLAGATPAALTWSGTINGTWDVNTTANWNAGAEKFFTMDSVTFADSPTNLTVSINGTVLPSSVAFTNETSAYVIRGGTGAIGGTAAVTKSGAGSVTIWNNANTYTGGTIINGGTVVLNNGATLATGSYTPLGTGTITLNTGGTLQLNPGAGGANVYTFANNFNLAGGTLFADDGDNTLTGTVSVTAPSVLRAQYGGKDLFLTGPLQGSAGLTISDTAGFYGAGSVYMAGDGSGYNGTITINTGHLVAQTDNGLRNAKLAVETPASADLIGFTLGGTASNVTIAGLTGNSAGARVQNADDTLRTLTVDSATDSIFAGSIGKGTIDTSAPNQLSVVKAGSGSLTLAGSNSYIGTTTVTGGTLVVPSSNSSLDYTVANGAALGVKLSQDSPSLIVNDMKFGTGGATSLNFQNFQGSTEYPALDTLNVQPDGIVTINVAGNFTTGTFPLILAKTIGGDGWDAFVLGSLPRGIIAHLQDDGDVLNLVVTGTGSLVWKGNLSTAWDVNTTSNWQLGSVAEKFLDGDAVLFNNTAGANTNVALNTAVVPAGVTVNSSANYVISGSGSIGGAGGIAKSGTGSLELGTANTFAGAVQISQGTVKIGSGSALGTTASGTTVAGGGSLDLNGQAVGAEALSIEGSAALVNSSTTAASIGGVITLPNSAAIGGAGDITLGTSITGSGDLTKTGAGALNITAASGGFTGAIVVQGGVLNLLADRALPNSVGTTIESGATVAVGIDNATRNANQNTLVKSGGTLTVSDGFTTNFGTDQGASYLTLEGGATLGGSAPEPYWGSWTINTVDRKITVEGGVAQAAVISAVGVSPNGDNPVRLAVSDVTGSAATDLLVSGSFGAESDVAFGVEIDGGGTVEFTGTNIHTGTTKVLSGKLILGGASTLATASSLDIAAGATVTLNYTGTQTISTLVIGGTPMDAGTYGVGGITNPAISGTGTLVVSGGDPYLSWEKLHGIEGAGADTDSDGDGVPNGIEFIIGGDPSGPDSSSLGLLPTISTSPTTMTFVFRCREDAMEIAGVQYDDNLDGTWTLAEDGTGGVTIATADGVYPNDPIDNVPVKQVTVTIPRSLAKTFARLTAMSPVE